MQAGSPQALSAASVAALLGEGLGANRLDACGARLARIGASASAACVPPLS
ncbi:MAG: hypothetical protein LC769_01920 [Chloroflexi bacterium]|nr:hypothetical protein [Chloroflexota bacterium]